MIINGGPGDETLTGTAGDDVIDGGDGADTMIGLPATTAITSTMPATR